MVNYLRTPQLVIALAATLALVTTAPFVQAQIEQAQGNTYIVQTQNGDVMEIRADRIARTQNQFVTLQRGNQTVAIFSIYQMMYVVQESSGADNVFEMQSNSGTVVQFSADEMRLDAQGLVELRIDGQLSGIVGNQTRYVRLVDEVDEKD